ncbi:uncharacterized protein BDW70DRAFT_2097 [Aspergillus foveolatus]|uniref:uncharacterized protein n=1 Tax=Aspergillus foveolatus TaxID=210207 RepID=UPI003CCCBCAD
MVRLLRILVKQHVFRTKSVFPCPKPRPDSPLACRHPYRRTASYSLISIKPAQSSSRSADLPDWNRESNPKLPSSVLKPPRSETWALLTSRFILAKGSSSRAERQLKDGLPCVL